MVIMMMKYSNLTIEHSSRRPANSAWCVRSDGRCTYGQTRELALEQHHSMLELGERITDMLRCCAKYTSENS